MPPDGTLSDTDPILGCDQEPIHIPGSVQPHGHLLAFAGDDLRLMHASAAAEAVLGTGLAAAFGQPVSQLLAGMACEALRDGLGRLPAAGPMQFGRFRTAAGAAFQAIGHRSPDGHAVLELEAEAEGGEPGADATLEGLYPGVRDALARLGRAASVEQLATTSAAAVRQITGFDRVLVYRFEPNWDGIVVAEDGNGRLPSYLGLRFPASDIPAQARRLYEVNPQRLIADVDYVPVPIRSARPGPTLDLTFASLRSVSPVHLEYMRNMGTPASMSVSILRGDGRLWGLISCHHAVPRRVSFAARNACDLVAQMFAVRVAAREEMAQAEARAQLKGLEGRLIARMAAAGCLEGGLLAVPRDLLDLAGATGAAVLTEGGCTLAGRTPPEAAVRRIAAWLQERGVDEVLETHCLASLMPGADALVDTASGLLAVPVSRIHPSFVLWFRPEVISTVTWGGAPRQPDEPAPDRLHPRRSFAAWAETVRRCSVPWTAAEVAAARDLQSAILGIVLRAAEERAELTGRLERVNQELAAFSYSVSHDLRAPFRHIVGFAELLREREGEALSDRGRRYISTIAQAAENAGRLVDALLNFSQMGRTALVPIEFDPARLVAEVRQALEPEQDARRIDWRIAPMPAVWADPAMLRQVFQNLLSNAVKYTRGRDPAVIEVTCEAGEAAFTFHVRDNGTGFDMAYAHKLFGVFQRLHRTEEFEGVGIGLANVQRIVERHGGRVWAEGRLGEGAAFHFTLPRRGEPAAETT
ncbi:ATP-binding protein [Paracraurococcus ruber]|uniref:histidine kinase n=1 Tax=Paracraurococcus ruber TaxID=77675 RepID=A0ABS1CXA3_9PROT|nr:ATP-binding protein [Paracraurococcus ruber]MBK1659159.1 ATPase [Paracraurococcus ruber]TDG29878.1 GAF domain-containing protein [Paracraurococcus ruber]